MVLRNIGRGPALRVQVKDISLVDIIDSVPFVAKFRTTDYIEPGKDVMADVFLTEAGEETTNRFHFLAKLKPAYAIRGYAGTETTDVTISYEDINGQRRESAVRMEKSGFRLLSPRKV